MNLFIRLSLVLDVGEEVDVVFVRANLVIPDLVALFDAETGILQGFRDFGGEHISAILRGAHEVIQDEVPVVAFGDMLWHFLMLPLRSPKQSFEEKGLYSCESTPCSERGKTPETPSTISSTIRMRMS